MCRFQFSFYFLFIGLNESGLVLVLSYSRPRHTDKNQQQKRQQRSGDRLGRRIPKVLSHVTRKLPIHVLDLFFANIILDRRATRSRIYCTRAGMHERIRRPFVPENFARVLGKIMWERCVSARDRRDTPSGVVKCDTRD